MRVEVYADGSPMSASTLHWLKSHGITPAVKRASDYQDFLGLLRKESMVPTVIIYSDEGHYVARWAGFRPDRLAQYLDVRGATRKPGMEHLAAFGGVS